MFDKLKAVSAIAGLMKNQDALKEATGRVKAKLAQARCTGEAGSGACKVTVSGELKVTLVELAPGLLNGGGDPKTRALAQNLVMEATNNAMTKAQALIAETIQVEAKQAGLGDLIGDVKGLMG